MTKKSLNSQTCYMCKCYPMVQSIFQTQLCFARAPRGRKALEQLPAQGFHPALGHGKNDTWPGLGKEIRGNESSSETTTAFIFSGRDGELCTAKLPMARQRNQSCNQTRFESLVPNLKQGNVLKRWAGKLDWNSELCACPQSLSVGLSGKVSIQCPGFRGSHRARMDLMWGTQAAKCRFFVMLVQPALGELSGCYFPSCSAG